MPAESQLLYFHMVLRADDDGIVESYPLMRLLGFATDNFKVLVAKGFIRPLNEDQVIVISDWSEHNVIRADRKVNSIYLSLLTEKYPELPVIVPKPRTDVEDNSKRVGGQSTDGISQVKLSKGKVRNKREVATLPTPSFFEDSEWQKRESTVLAERHALSVPFCEGEIIKFISYWTEKNERGKMRYQGQKFFDVGRRLATWFSRVKSDSPKEYDKPVVVEDLPKRERRTYLKGQLIKTEKINLNG